MGMQDHKQAETKQGQMRVSCEFSERTDEKILYEVKSVLSAVLQEYLHSLDWKRE